MPSIRSFVLIIGLAISPISIASAKSTWNTGTPVNTGTHVTEYTVEDGVRILKAVGPEAAAILRDGTIISKIHKSPWYAYFIVKWNDTIADCSISLGSIKCFYPVGLVNED